MNRQTGNIRWMFRSRRTRRLDKIALGIADKYRMRKEYLAARKFGMEPLFALEEYELGTIEERMMFENGCF